MTNSETLARIRHAQQGAQHQSDQDTLPFTEEAEVVDSTPTEHEEPLLISTEPLHPATFHRTGDGGFAIGEYPVVKIEPTADPALFTCYTAQPDGTSQDHSIEASAILLAAQGLGQASMEREAGWFSAYLLALGQLKMLSTTVFAETTLGSALCYAWGSAPFLEELKRANELLPLFPTKFSDTASLFASCLSLESLLARLSHAGTRANLTPFVERILGGQAFLETFSQLQMARSSLPTLVLADDPLPPVDMPAASSVAARQSTCISIIHKEDEAAPLRDEIVDHKDPLTQLYLAVVLGATTFLAIVLQPGVSPFTACLLPLAGLSLALKIAAYDLRPGQINFYLRRVLLSPWEICRRVLFDGSQLSEQEQSVLKEQNIVITEALLKDAKELRPPFPEMHSTANRIAILIFEGAAIGVLILRSIDAIAQRDIASITQTIIALAISGIATLYSIKVLRRKRVR